MGANLSARRATRDGGAARRGVSRYAEGTARRMWLQGATRSDEGAIRVCVVAVGAAGAPNTQTGRVRVATCAEPPTTR